MLSAFSLGASPARTKQERTENAAVKYLRADAALRQAYPLPPDAGAKLERSLESPLNADDQKLIAAAQDALAEFEHGASLANCDWAMSFEDGPLANTAHRGAVRELVAVAGLRARLRFQSGDTPGALKDALAAIAGARHLSVDGSLASVLIAHKLEKELTELLAQNLDRFSPDELNQLTTGLDALPRGSNVSRAFETEKLQRNDLLPLAEVANSREGLIEELLKRIPALQSNNALAVEIVDGCGGSVNGFATCVRQQESFYASWAPLFTLPPDQFESRYKSEIEVVSKTNAVIRVFTPNLPRFRWAEAYCETRRALLKVAINIRLNGPNALKQVLDPYDRTLFSYVPVEGGFQLKSHLNDGGTPISLVIGSR